MGFGIWHGTWQIFVYVDSKRPSLWCNTHTHTPMHVYTHTHTPIQPTPLASLWIAHALALRGVLLPGNEEEGGGEAGAAAGEQWATCGSFECLSTLVHLSATPPPHSLHLTLFHPPPSSQTGGSVNSCLLPVNSPTRLHHFSFFF